MKKLLCLKQIRFNCSSTLVPDSLNYTNENSVNVRIFHLFLTIGCSDTNTIAIQSHQS